MNGMGSFMYESESCLFSTVSWFLGYRSQKKKECLSLLLRFVSHDWNISYCCLNCRQRYRKFHSVYNVYIAESPTLYSPWGPQWKKRTFFKNLTAETPIWNFNNFYYQFRFWPPKVAFYLTVVRLATQINITLFVGNEVLNIFHSTVSEKTIFSKLTAKNNFCETCPLLRERGVGRQKWM